MMPLGSGVKCRKEAGEEEGNGWEGEVRQRRQEQEREKRQKQQEKQRLEASLYPKARADKRSKKSTKQWRFST